MKHNLNTQQYSRKKITKSVTCQTKIYFMADLISRLWCNIHEQKTKAIKGM